MPNPKLLTCRQMAERIKQRNPGLTVTKFIVWDVATNHLRLKPAFQQTPTDGQRKAGGATMFFTAKQERKIEAAILARTPQAVAA